MLEKNVFVVLPFANFLDVSEFLPAVTSFSFSFSLLLRLSGITVAGLQEVVVFNLVGKLSVELGCFPKFEVINSVNV
jgi:hypothetical protein